MNGIPYGPAEGLLRLGYTAVLLLVIIGLSYLKRLGIGRELAIAVVRGFCQLMVLALVFTFIFDSPDWWLMVWALFAAMVGMAGWTSSRRAREIPRAFEITVPSITAGAALALSVMALTGIMPMGPQFVIPLSGMAFGNTMNTSSLTLNRIAGEFKNNRRRIEAALALGATADQAATPYLNLSVRSALIPTIDSMKTLGIIFIPGAMAGLLLAGTPPLVAAVYQIAVYFMIMSAGITTSSLASYLARKKLFTEAHQLKEMA